MAPLSNSVKVTVAFHLRDLNGVPEARNCLNQPASALTVHISSRKRPSPVRHTKPSFEPAQELLKRFFLGFLGRLMQNASP
jgi:hypothetical protein